MKTIKISMVVALICFLSSCGGGLRGVYKSQTDGLDTELKFISKNKVQVKNEIEIKEFEYEKDGKQVKININGEINVFNIDDAGCLNGSGDKFCVVD